MRPRLHGAASLAAEAFIDSIPHPTAAARVVGEWLRRGEPLPGFGHPLYPEGDPRATALIEALRPALADAPALAVAEAVLAAVQGRGLPPANVDFALAAFVRAAGMVHGAGEAIFAVARTAGWIAHALEEYAERTVLRARAVYTGPVRSPESRV
jgi:citrate synthase